MVNGHVFLPKIRILSAILHLLHTGVVQKHTGSPGYYLRMSHPDGPFFWLRQQLLEW